MIPNIEDILQSLYEDKQFIDEKQKQRKEKYLQGTKQFQDTLQKEIQIIEKNRDMNNKRNQQIKEQISDLYTRYYSGQLRLIRAQRKTVEQKIILNEYLINSYPLFNEQKKSKMLEQKQNLERRLNQLKEMNRKENINVYEALTQKQDNPRITDEIEESKEKIYKQIAEKERQIESTRQIPIQSNRTEYLDQFLLQPRRKNLPINNINQFQENLYDNNLLTGKNLVRYEDPAQIEDQFDDYNLPRQQIVSERFTNNQKASNDNPTSILDKFQMPQKSNRPTQSNQKNPIQQVNLLNNLVENQSGVQRENQLQNKTKLPNEEKSININTLNLPQQQNQSTLKQQQPSANKQNNMQQEKPEKLIQYEYNKSEL